MKNTRIVTISFWMRHLHLSLVEKMVYAVIFGFSQDGDSNYHGSRQYLADWCECSLKTIDRALAHLCELGFIHKREVVMGGVKFCRYSVDVPTVDKMSLVGTNCPEGSDILGDGRDILTHNNIVKEVSNETSKERESKEREKSITPSRFVPPTFEEVKEYCEKRKSPIDPEKFVNYYKASGWKLKSGNSMKDWKAAICNWESREKERKNGTNRPADNGSPTHYRQIGRNDDYGESTI